MTSQLIPDAGASPVEPCVQAVHRRGSYASPPGQMLSLSQGGSSPRGIRRRGGFENRPFFNCQISLGGLLRFFFSTTGRFSKTLAWRNGWFSKPSRLRVPYKVPRCSAAVIGNLTVTVYATAKSLPNNTQF